MILASEDTEFPNRQEWILAAWGTIPISYVQESEDINEASYLDIKVNKWELNPVWSKVQAQEPWIRIEFIRGEEIRYQTQATKRDRLLVILELDGPCKEVDYQLLYRLAQVLVQNYGFELREPSSGALDAILVSHNELTEMLRTGGLQDWLG